MTARAVPYRDDKRLPHTDTWPRRLAMRSRSAQQQLDRPAPARVSALVRRVVIEEVTRHLEDRTSMLDFTSPSTFGLVASAGRAD